FARGQKQIGSAVVAQKESKAITMALNQPGDEVSFRCSQNLSLFVICNLPVALHGVQATLEACGKRMLCTHRPSQFEHIVCPTCRAQHFQHGFAAGDIWVKIGRQRMSWVGARTVVFVFCSLCQRKFRWLKNRLYYES